MSSNYNNKYVDETDEFFIDEQKNKSGGNILRQDSELFDDNSYIPHELLSVKRVSLPKSGEDWEIIRDKKVVFTLKGVRFAKKEKEFFKTANGILFIMNGYKAGWRTIAEFKRQVKKCL